MSLNYSLSLKLTVLIVSISALVIITITYVNIMQQRDFFEEAYYDKAISIAHAFDSSFLSNNGSKNHSDIQAYLTNFTYLNSDIFKLHINIPGDNGLRVIASTDESLIGSESNFLRNEEI